MKTKSRFINKKFILPSFIFALMGAFIIFSSRYVKVSLEGIKLYAAVVLPALFPFFFLSNLLIKSGSVSAMKSLSPFTKKLFGLNASGAYCFTIGALSGYPVGASVVCDLKTNGTLSCDESETAAVLSSVCGPVFVIGSVGSIMFDSIIKGTVIYLSHIMAVVTSAIILRNRKLLSNKKLLLSEKSQNPLYDSVYSSVISVLVAGGFITLFYVLTQMLADAKLLNLPIYVLNFAVNDKNIASGVIYGIFECTTGLKLISQSANMLSVPFAAFTVSLGGVSVILQSYVFLKKAKIKPTKFFVGKILQAVLAFVYCYLICFVCKI